jgi:acyl-CoA thioester hydrolase
MTERLPPLPRAHFPRLLTLTTRWMDNDVYGHVNNAIYYSFFDTAVNRYLIEAGALDIRQGEVIGLVVQTQCHYFEPIAFPQAVQVGLKVAHRGRSSVRYELGLFVDDAPHTAAVGIFVHVYVDRAGHRPVPIPPAILCALAELERPA